MREIFGLPTDPRLRLMHVEGWEHLERRNPITEEIFARDVENRVNSLVQSLPLDSALLDSTEKKQWYAEKLAENIAAMRDVRSVSFEETEAIERIEEHFLKMDIPPASMASLVFKQLGTVRASLAFRVFDFFGSMVGLPKDTPPSTLEMGMIAAVIQKNDPELNYELAKLCVEKNDLALLHKLSERGFTVKEQPEQASLLNISRSQKLHSKEMDKLLLECNATLQGLKLQNEEYLGDFVNELLLSGTKLSDDNALALLALGIESKSIYRATDQIVDKIVLRLSRDPIAVLTRIKEIPTPPNFNLLDLILSDGFPAELKIDPRLQLGNIVGEMIESIIKRSKEDPQPVQSLMRALHKFTRDCKIDWALGNQIAIQGVHPIEYLMTQELGEKEKALLVKFLIIELHVGFDSFASDDPEKLKNLVRFITQNNMPINEILPRSNPLDLLEEAEDPLLLLALDIAATNLKNLLHDGALEVAIAEIIHHGHLNFREIYAEDLPEAAKVYDSLVQYNPELLAKLIERDKEFFLNDLLPLTHSYDMIAFALDKGLLEKNELLANEHLDWGKIVLALFVDTKQTSLLERAIDALFSRGRLDINDEVIRKTQHCLELYVATGKPLQSLSVEGVPILHFLADKRMLNLIPVLLQAGADPTVKNKKGESLLHRILNEFPFSEEKFPQNEVAAIIDAMDNELKEQAFALRDADGKTPLMVALEVQVPWSEALLNAVIAASPVTIADHLARTPLLAALDAGRPDVFQLILDAHYPELGTLFHAHFSNPQHSFTSEEVSRFVLSNLPKILDTQFREKNPLELALLFHSRAIAQALYKELGEAYATRLTPLKDTFPEDVLEFMEYPALSLGDQAFFARTIPEAPEGVQLEDMLEVFDRIVVVEKEGALEPHEISPAVLKGKELAVYRNKLEEVVHSVKNNIHVVASPEDETARKEWYAGFEKALLHIIKGLKDEEKFDPVALISFAEDCMNCGDRWQTEVLSFYEQMAGQAEERDLPQRALDEMARYRRGIVQHMIPIHHGGSTHVYTKLINILTEPVGLGIAPIEDPYADQSTKINREMALRGYLGRDCPKGRIEALQNWMNGLEADQKSFLVDSWLTDRIPENWQNDRTEAVFKQLNAMRNQQKTSEEIVQLLEEEGLRVPPYKGQPAVLPEGLKRQVGMIAKSMEQQVAKLIEKMQGEDAAEEAILTAIKNAYQLELSSLNLAEQKAAFEGKAAERFTARLPKPVETETTIEEAIAQSLQMFSKQQYLDTYFRREHNGRLEYTAEAAIAVLTAAGSLKMS